MQSRKVIMSDTKWNNMCLDAKSITYYRRNPCIASKDLLGIRLIDSQKYILQTSWNTTFNAWACSRNFGKSFLIAVMAILKAILYENQNIYIISSVGSQAKETFTKIEEIVLNKGRTSESIAGLEDIVKYETVSTPANKDGFKHPPDSYSVTFYNGSSIYTLNSKPDNIRGRRATVIFFDEAAFCSDEILAVAKAFGAQETDFRTSVKEDYDPRKRPKQIPIQVVYASSQDGMDTIFYKNYKDFAKQMIAGNRDYFTCDMPCNTATTVYMEGKKYPPLLSQTTIDAAMQENPEKAKREYYNIPTMDGGVTQIVKWANIRQNEKLIIPYKEWRPENRVVLAFDPARTGDNSILSAMNLYEDPDIGLCGDIINCVNFIDLASKKKYKLDSNRQVRLLRNYLVAYNGENPDYEYIDSLLIDGGAGGGGQSTYADRLLEDWYDDHGRKHKGLIDKDNELYEGYSKLYKNAVDKLKLISPKAYRTQMVEEFIDLFRLGVIKLPFEYTGQEFIRITKTSSDKKKCHDAEEEYDLYYLSPEEKRSFAQIDLMKNEITSIHKTMNPEKTSVRYALAKEKENRMHDDRFYTILLLAHRLYELRRENAMRSRKKSKTDVSTLLQIRAPRIK